MMRTAFSILILAARRCARRRAGHRLDRPCAAESAGHASRATSCASAIWSRTPASRPNTPIFRAPDLGQTGAVPVRAVLDAVRPYGLIAVEARGLTEVAVTRASRTIAADDIEAAHRARAHRTL